MKFYIQVNQDGYITDAITYSHGDYIECELPTPLPDMFLAGVYKYLGSNQVELDQEKMSELLASMPSELTQEQTDFLAGLMEGFENE